MLKFLKLASAGLLIVACSTKETPKATLNITTTGVSDDEITISMASADSTIATDTLTNGAAIIDLPLSKPAMIVIEIPSLSKPIVFFADVTAMELSINGENDPPSFEIKGSVYQDSLDVFADAQQANRMFMQDYYPAWQEAMQANDSLTMAIISAKMDSAYYGFEEYTKAFANRNGIVGALVAQRFIYQAEYQELNDVYENIPVLFRDDELVVELKERVDILENTQIGKRFTDITQKDTTGNPLSISNVSGKFVLIDFWASWCGPCRAANPDLVKIYDEFNPKGFEIVGVSLDQSGDRWKNAIVTDDLTWAQMSDLQGWDNAGAKAYAIRAIPQSVLIDHQGFIVRKNLSTEELRTFLIENLN